MPTILSALLEIQRDASTVGLFAVPFILIVLKIKVKMT